MYKAKIERVLKGDGEVKTTIKYSNESGMFEKSHILDSMEDINNQLNLKVRDELKRLNELEDGFQTLKAREGEEIDLID